MNKKFQLFFFLTLSFQLINFSQLCSVQQKTESLREYFKDVLLIINFNHPHYANIEFLKEIYSPYFPNIVFYGEKEHPEVNKIDHNLGWFVHRAMSDAMTRWPNYRGYICCQDDCFMNFWNFTRLDKDKIWLHHYWIQSLVLPNDNWPWWNMPCGLDAVIAAYSKLPTENFMLLEKNCGPYRVAYSWADFFYIPAKYKEEFIRINTCFDNPDVFIEIAIPTLVLSLEDNKQMEKLNPYWGGTISSIDLEEYDSDYDWIHPLKFSVETNRQFIRETIKAQLKPLPMPVPVPGCASKTLPL